MLECPLTYAGGAYAIDWADLDAKLADPQTTLMILCNPHNPTGQIWDKETLARIGVLAPGTMWWSSRTRSIPS